MSSRRVVGIDLGTSNTSLAWVEQHAETTPTAFAVEQLSGPLQLERRTLLPSALYRPDAAAGVPAQWLLDDWVVGAYARDKSLTAETRSITSAKSWLCHARVDRLAPILPWGSPEAKLSPVQASANILRHLRQRWNAEHADAPLEAQHVVLTVPASFDPLARHLTMQAAKLAELDVHLLEEPLAAFYWYLRAGGLDELSKLVAARQAPLVVLICDVGGGTTDLTLIAVTKSGAQLELRRLAVGRHLLLGGDNLDLAIAQLCAERLATNAPFAAERFRSLAAGAREAKERLLGPGAPERYIVSIANSSATLVGNSRSVELARADVENLLYTHFLADPSRSTSRPKPRGGFVTFGLPYESNVNICAHVAEFIERNAANGIDAVLLNGGFFESKLTVKRFTDVLHTLLGRTPALLSTREPGLAVARGAAIYGQSLLGTGLRVIAGAPHSYCLELAGERAKAVCVVPKGAQEGERFRIDTLPFELTTGRTARFQLLSTTSPHVAGAVIEIKGDESRTALATSLGAVGSVAQQVPVHLEGGLSAVGTLELEFSEVSLSKVERLHRLDFDVREPPAPKRSDDELQLAAQASSLSSRPPQMADRSSNLGEAETLLDTVFGKAKSEVAARAAKDLLRDLERLLGERKDWPLALVRTLFDKLLPLAANRKRSEDHERVFWMLAGLCIRPGFGDVRDPERIAALAPLFQQGLIFGEAARSWQQFFIAWRRAAAGLAEPEQLQLREKLDPFLAPSEARLPRPKGFKPLAQDELLALSVALERVPQAKRGSLCRWLLERTWTKRDPALWTAIGRIGARIPAYASVHYVLPARIAEELLDHLLRERWPELPTAAGAAFNLARVTGDPERDVSHALRLDVALRLEQSGAPAAWAAAVRSLVALKEADRRELFDNDLPIGIRLSTAYSDSIVTL